MPAKTDAKALKGSPDVNYRGKGAPGKSSFDLALKIAGLALAVMFLAGAAYMFLRGRPELGRPNAGGPGAEPPKMEQASPTPTPAPPAVKKPASPTDLAAPEPAAEPRPVAEPAPAAPDVKKAEAGPPAVKVTDLKGLARELGPVIRAESRPLESGEKAAAMLAALAADSAWMRPPLETALAGALAFLNDDFKKSEAAFQPLTREFPAEPAWLSFMAVTELRQGNPGKAREFYAQALALREKGPDEPLLLANDQMGLALALFHLHEPQAALPLALSAYETRLKLKGADNLDTISAANRLTTILIALNQTDQAETIIRGAWRELTQDRARFERNQNEPILAETKLLLQTLYTGKGRADELAALLGAPGQLSSGSARTAAPKLHPKVSPQELADWDELAGKLMAAKSPLASDLFLKITEERGRALPGGDKDPSLWPWRLKLARAFLEADQPEVALNDLRPLLNEDELSPGLTLPPEGRADLEDLWLESLSAAGEFKEAGTFIQKRLEELESAKSKDPAVVGRVLELYIKLADNLLARGKVSEEAEIELRAAVNSLGRKNLDQYPEVAKVYLRLAQLVKDKGGKRARDAAAFYKQAQTNAQAALKKTTDPAKRAMLESVLAEVAEAGKPPAKAPRQPAAKKGKKGQPAQEAPPMPAVTAQAAPTPLEKDGMPDPETLRLDLSALDILGRLPEFQPIIDEIMGRAKQLYGDKSPLYFRYYSLKLKALEKEGRLGELTMELRRQASAPAGGTDVERAFNQASALAYAARANDNARNYDLAVKLYGEALAALEPYAEALPDRYEAARAALAQAREKKATGEAE